MTPNDLLEQLKSGANAQKRRNLDLIHQICQEQYQKGSKDFSIATIGRLSQQKGGPIIQSLRNKSGQDFRALIQVWSNHTGGFSGHLPKGPQTPLQSILNKIEDPAVRAVMESIIAENTKLKGQISLLKRSANVLIDMRPQTLYQTQTVELLPPCADLTESEKEALKHAISDAFFQAEGWATEENGRVKNAKGRVLYKPGYVTAIRKIIKNSPSDMSHKHQNHELEVR